MKTKATVIDVKVESGNPDAFLMKLKAMCDQRKVRAEPDHIVDVWDGRELTGTDITFLGVQQNEQDASQFRIALGVKGHPTTKAMREEFQAAINSEIGSAEHVMNSKPFVLAAA